MRSVFASSLILCLSAALGARADTVYLVNGKQLKGEVVQEGRDVIVLKVLSGVIRIRTSEVESIERQTPAAYRIELGRLLLSQRRYDQAVEVLREGCRLEPASAEARRALGGALLAQARFYRKDNRLQEASDTLTELQALGLNDPALARDAAETRQDVHARQQKLAGLIAQARAAGDWAAALPLFDQALKLTPDARKQIASELAVCYVQRATAAAQNGRPLNAATDLETALSLDPNLADRVESFYVSCLLPGILSDLANGAVSHAQTGLRRALAAAPANKQVLYVAGRLEEALAHVPEAAENYARALRTRVANPTPEYVAQLRAKLEKELAPGDWKPDTTQASLATLDAAAGPAQTLETKNFLIYHYNETLAAQAAEAAEFHRQRIMAELDLPLSAPVKIYLHRTQAEYTARTGEPEWTGGVAKYTVRPGGLADAQLHSWQASPRLLKSVIPHELTHLLLAANLPQIAALPRGLNEGVAISMEPEYRHAYFLHFLRARLKSHDFIPLEELLTRSTYPRDPEFLYAEGYALVAFLARADGLKSLVALFKTAPAAQNLRDELPRRAGVHTLDDLEEAWKKWILDGG